MLMARLRRSIPALETIQNEVNGVRAVNGGVEVSRPGVRVHAAPERLGWTAPSHAGYRDSIMTVRTAPIRRAFSLIELLIVMAVISALLATFVVVGLNFFKGSAKRGKAELELASIAAAIDGYEQKFYTKDAYTDDAVSFFLWDLPHDPADATTRDGIIDGTHFYDEATASWVPFSSIYPGYEGFVKMTKFKHQVEDLEHGDIDGSSSTPDEPTGQFLDPWRRPYRIVFYDETDTARFGNPPKNPFGSRWYGVYSLGPDGVDDTRDAPNGANDTASTDDVRGWVLTHSDQ